MSSHPIQRHRHLATAMLVLAALLWGLGFTWAKNISEALNGAAGQSAGAVVGPSVLLAMRFLAAAAIWLAMFPAARRGWTWASAGRGGILGGLMWIGVELQHIGLDQSSEAAIAFLTNLTVVIVPILVALMHRSWPHPSLAAAVILAVAGIGMLTGGKWGALTLGEWMGVGCAIAFSFEIIAINTLVPRDSAFRLTAAMFVCCGVLSLLAAALSPGFAQVDLRPLLSPGLALQLTLLIVLVTCVAFGLMNVYQPRVEPSRAAIIYLSEPIFAAAFAWVSEGAAMSAMALCGAGLILVANMIAELRWPRRRRMTVTPAKAT